MKTNGLIGWFLKPFLLVIGFVFLASALAATPEEAIKYRQAVMLAQQWHMKIMSRMVQGHVAYDKAEFTKRARNIAELSTMNHEGFLVKDSDLGDTRARLEVWSAMDKYQSDSDKFVTEAAKLVSISQGSDIGAINAQFGETLKSCDGCHSKYRSN